jgi:3-hydroxyisobutyrate dehydrogenase-like beta-hydroxyacid dehydrogenase
MLDGVTTVAVLHPGRMGAAVGALLVGAGIDVRWLPAGRGPGTWRRAEDAGLGAVDDLAGCDVVLSICPPAAAIDTAREVAGFGGLYVDANAISPATAARVRDLVEDGGAAYVDGGIIGGPPTEPGTRLYLSGPRALEVVALFDGTALDARVVDGDCAASALKMAYAAWSKISAALVLGIEATAREHGVAEALHEEWRLSGLDLADRLASGERAARAKGWRWVDEMRQIAATFDTAGQPEGFGAAAAEVFGRYPRVED